MEEAARNIWGLEINAQYNDHLWNMFTVQLHILLAYIRFDLRLIDRSALLPCSSPYCDNFYYDHRQLRPAPFFDPLFGYITLFLCHATLDSS